MSRKVRRVPVTIDSGDIRNLPEAEIIVILRAADEIVGQGGRNLLVKVLKGSRDKKVIEHDLDKCPAYGMYKSLAQEEVGHRVDWLIENDYLRIDYDYRLPLLYFTDKGWDIERETYSCEIFERFSKAAVDADMSIVEELREKTNRQVKVRVIELIGEKGTPNMLPLVEAWADGEVKKLKAALNSAAKEIDTRNTDS
jgi:superfamily II DNA helicase RecQ